MKTWTKCLIILALVFGGAAWFASAPATTLASPDFYQDCLTYNPNNLSIFQEGARWILTDGSSRLDAFASQADAELGLQVARLYNQHCFIGRGNSRPDRQRYIFEYWKGSSGISGSLPTNDCIAYDRASLAIADEGANGWVLTSSSSRIKMFDNMADAQAGLDLLSSYDRVCYIGRGTDYIMTYLYADMLTIVPGIIVTLEPVGPIVPLVPMEPLPIPVDPFLPIDPGILLPGEDCLPYNPNALYIENLGATGWRLTDGSSSMVIFDNEADANIGLQNARAHTEHCFIGRDNTRANRYAYIFEYWQGDSGLGVPVPDYDCLPHDPAALTIEDLGANGWRLNGGSEAIQLFDNYGDALAGLNVMQQYDRHCYIGRDNTRPNRYAYIMQYQRTSTPPVPGPGPMPMPTGEDCLSYDPFGLVLNDLGATGWQLISGASAMMLLDNQPDAQLAASVALAHREQCFIGRSNTRPDRYAYIFEYWKGDSGIGVEPPLGDCVEYNPLNLTLVDAGANGWQIVDGTHSILLMDTQADATLARDVMQAHNMLCFIGRSNARPDRSRYVHTYLRDAPAAFPTPTPSPAPLPATPCAGAPMPRMILNHVGRVTFTTGEPVRVRTGPGTSNSILLLLPEGTLFYVTGGPVCSEPYWWWAVQTSTGVNGWMAEGVVGNYFIEPFSP